jgi:hypothetical protein
MRITIPSDQYYIALDYLSDKGYRIISSRQIGDEIEILCKKVNHVAISSLSFESNFTPTTLPILPYIEIEQLHDTRNQLIEKRRELFNSWFLFLRPGKNKQSK